jgi:hypothetical protein
MAHCWRNVEEVTLLEGREVHDSIVAKDDNSMSQVNLGGRGLESDHTG